MNKFPERLKELREEKGLSQNELARRLDMRSATISRWENNERRPLIDNIVALCLFFNVSAGYLIGLED